MKKVKGDFETLAKDWIADETFRGAGRVEFLEGRVLSLARQLDATFDGMRKTLSIPATKRRRKKRPQL